MLVYTIPQGQFHETLRGRFVRGNIISADFSLRSV